MRLLVLKKDFGADVASRPIYGSSSVKGSICGGPTLGKPFIVGDEGRSESICRSLLRQMMLQLGVFVTRGEAPENITERDALRDTHARLQALSCAQEVLLQHRRSAG